MRLSEDIDFTTLTWVKSELDETLKQARHALEAYVEDPADASQMRFCATYLHQVQGTLRMVELYGAAMVTEEMERLATALLEEEVRERDEAYTVLMRGIVQLPDYLERLQGGHRDIPIVLLPLLNELRSARGEKGLSESVLFTPDLGRALPVSASGPQKPMPELELRQLAEQLRGQFQISLLNWFRSVDIDGNIDRMAQVCDRLVAVTQQEEARRLFWVAAGVLEALRAKAFEPSPQLKQTIGKVEREIKRLADAGESSFRVDPPRELTRNLLYFVAHAPTEHGRIGELRQVFRLDALLPSEDELQHARGAMSGHNRALLDTVSAAIKDDLMRVKDALDLHMRSTSAQAGDLSAQVEVLDRVADTLGMLGLGVARRVVQEQRDAVQQVAAGDRPADESTLLDIAGALLYVEASLDDQVQHLGSATRSEKALPQAEGRKVLEAVVKEAQANFAQAKQCFVAFVESSWDHAQLQDVPRLLDEVAGALRIMEVVEAPQYLLAVRRFTENELLARHRVPNAQQMDTLADALASLEYYLEALRDQRPNRDKILAVTRESLEGLGYWPIPDAIAAPAPAPSARQEADASAHAPASATAQDTAGESQAAASDLQPTDFAEHNAHAPFAGEDRQAQVAAEAQPPAAAAAPAGVPAAPAAGGLSGFEATTDDIDEEIREVFVEEVQEEIGNLQSLLPLWKADPTNVEHLKPIRRVFHTLKGSGRLVGALTLGEFSWKVENMLNRVLDKTVAPGPAAQALVEHAAMALPQLLDALRGVGRVHADLEQLKSLADRIAAGEEAWYVAPVATGIGSGDTPQAAVADAVADAADAAEAEPVLEDVAEVEPVDAAAQGAEPDSALADAGDDVPAAGTVAVAPIDPVLFEILRAEVAGHLETVDAYLARCEASPQPVDDPLLRAIHTMNGAFAMTEVPSITDVVSPLEGYIKRLLAQRAAPSTLGVALMAQSAAMVRTCMLALEAEQPRLPLLDALAEQIIAERDTLPEPVGPSIPVGIGEDLHEDDLPAMDAAAFAPLQPSEAASHESTFGAIDSGAIEAVALDQVLVGEEAPNAGATSDGPTSDGPTSDGPTSGHVASEDGEDAPGADATSEEFASQEFAGDAGYPDTAAFVDQGAEDAEPGLHAPASDAVGDVAAQADVAEHAAADEAGFDLAALLQGGSLPDAAPGTDTALGAGMVDGEPAQPLEQDTATSEPDTLEQELFALGDAEGAAAALESFDFELVEFEHSGEATAGSATDGPVLEQPTAVDLPSDGHAAALAALFDTFASREVGDTAGADHDHERVEAERLEAERLEAERVEAERLEAERAETVRVEAERAEAERAEAERLEAERVEAERAEAERAEAERAEAERAEAERVEAERLEAERVEAERAEAERVEAERAEAERLEAERVEAERLEAERLEAERLEAERLEAERLEAERLEWAELEELTRPDAVVADGSEPSTVDAGTVAESDEVVVPAGSGQVAIAAAAITDPDAPLDTSDMDEELLDIFLEEGGDILDHSDGLLASLRQDPSDRELVVGLQRDLHTLKGGARMAGLAPIGDLGHAMESLLEAVADGRRELGRGAVEVLERSFDRLHAMVTRVGERRAIAMPTPLIDRVEALVRGETLDAPAATASVVPAAADPALQADAAATSTTIVPAPLGEALFDEEDEVASITRAPQEQIRIRADLLDRLVNYAGEVAIYRARLEQQLGTFRISLTELEATTSRLREQLRRLEIETEAQIIARYQREADDSDSNFDPLELDRFSTLQQLSRALGESAADLVNLQGTLDDQTRQYETLLLQQSRVSSDLQEGLMRTRMVPFDALVPRLRRILRQTCGELGKKAQLRVDGAQGEMDRNVLDRMTAPLEHMLRNALAHGMEMPDVRRDAGKPEEGTVRIAVSREASEVVIRVTDDGRGMDREAIRRKAIERGLMKPDAQLSDRDLYGFILETGFSTAETVSKIAGRGVGMDVVNSEIKQLGGALFIESEPGKGTTFIVRLPFTLAVTQAVFVKLGETSFAVPISSVQGVARIGRRELEEQLASGSPSYEYAGEHYAIYDLGLLLGQSHVRAEESLQIPLLLARSGDLLAAICVDQVIGSREIVVKPSGPQVSSVPGIFGATVMGDGRVVVILDVAPLVRRSAALNKIGDAPVLPAAPQEVRRIPLVMVVDDSITMRKVTGRVLERHNFEVMTAKDGVDAIEKLQERLPDVMLLDIEMPRMDGYELATHMRNDARLRHVPIIMITSRTGEKHRQRAFEIGVDRYLGKPYQEAELMRNVNEILEVGRVVAR